MLFKTRSAAVYGIEAYLVDVEVNISTGGNGQVVIVGLPDTAVRESKNRVLPAIRNNGFGAPYQRIVINLGPADVKKEGSAFDLPMGHRHFGWIRPAGKAGRFGLPDDRRAYARWQAASGQEKPNKRLRNLNGTNRRNVLM
jgi:Mg-chelatase subunit ChlI-like protein